MSQELDIKLTAEQLQTLIEHLQEANRLLPQFDNLEACGRNCDERRQELEILRRNYEELKERFG